MLLSARRIYFSTYLVQLQHRLFLSLLCAIYSLSLEYTVEFDYREKIFIKKKPHFSNFIFLVLLFFFSLENSLVGNLLLCRLNKRLKKLNSLFKFCQLLRADFLCKCNKSNFACDDRTFFVVFIYKIMMFYFLRNGLFKLRFYFKVNVSKNRQ